MLKSISLLSGVFVLAASASAQAPSKLQRIEAKAPIHAGTYYAATDVFVRARAGETSLFSSAATTRGGATSSVIYNNNNFAGAFHNINGDVSDMSNPTNQIILDEGRIPSLTSPSSMSPVSFPGTSNSYKINAIQIGYATNSGFEGSARIGLYNQYDTCTAPEANGSPIIDLIVTGLPESLVTGQITPYTFDIDLTGIDFCMVADGDGKYDDEFSDRFGWVLSLLTPNPSDIIGPLVGARPGPFAPTGDGTVFQNPGAMSGSGLSTVDQWFNRTGLIGGVCLNEGGYDPVTNDPAFGSFWLVLGADLNADCASCDMRIDDNFENNDTCGTAVPLPAPGVFPNLVTQKQGVDSDFYVVTIPARSGLQALATFPSIDGDINLNALLSDCSGLITTASTSSTDFEVLTLFNCGPTSVDFVLEVFVDAMSASDCNQYDLSLEVVASCDGIDDALEDNDTCGTAGLISEGFTSGLRASVCDLDYYEIVLGNGQSLDITITFDDTLADLDLLLFEEGPTCDTGAGLLEFSAGVTGIESVKRLNDTGSTQVYILRVDVFATTTAAGCATYDLNFDRNGGTQIGQKFCFSEINSSGAGAHIFLTGSATVSLNNLILNAEQLPLNSFGFFLNSMGQGFVPNPGGSTGNLCIAAPAVGRFDTILPLPNSGSTGTVSFTANLDIWPQPTGAIMVMPGDTWNLQYWFRDETVPAGPTSTSNLSDAVQVTFN